MAGEGLIDLERNIIDEFYVNGFNQYKAVKKFRPDITDSVASAYYNTLVKKETSKQYLAEKFAMLRAETGIRSIQVLRELMQLSYSDITDYIDLTSKELKELPPDLRRCIGSIEEKTKSYKDRSGKMVKETTYKIRLIDKLKAMDMLNKHIGFYEADNSQKKTNINLTKVDKATLNILLNAIEE
jgi:hypothetical protein